MREESKSLGNSTTKLFIDRWIVECIQDTGVILFELEPDNWKWKYTACGTTFQCHGDFDTALDALHDFLSLLVCNTRDVEMFNILCSQEESGK
jgi:hypothetical protein